MNQVQKSLSKQFGAWQFKTLLRMIIAITVGKHEGSSAHRDGSNGGKVITNIETGQNSEVITTVETDQNLQKVVPKIAMDEQDSGRGQSSRHRIRAERVAGSKIGTKNTQRIRDEHADGSKIGARRSEREFVVSSLMHPKLQQENMKESMAKSLTDRKLNQDGDVTEQCVNQSGTAENGSEHAACQVKVQNKVVTTWLFDTRADAHVMPKCVWEQLGEFALQTKNVTLR